MTTKETFLPGYKNLPDETLLIAPSSGVLTEKTMFVCTYVARLIPLRKDVVEATKIICSRELKGNILVVNSNFGHVAQEGYDYLLKTAEKKKKKNGNKIRTRKVQGDGTCFNSTIEPIIRIDYPGMKENKIYKVKCFPTTGETQIPGVVQPDLSDARPVLDVLVNFLNELKMGENGEPIYYENDMPKMLDYKFRVIRSCPRLLVNLRNLAIYLQRLEENKLRQDTKAEEDDILKITLPFRPVLPTHFIREIKPPTTDVKVSLKFTCGDRQPKVNIFQSGKINILGADSNEHSEDIYAFFLELFTKNWEHLVCLKPRSDEEIEDPICED